MHGPNIMARSIEACAIPDKFGNTWQYHSQSDRHSRIACWAILFDLMQHCPLLRKHAAAGKVGFGINHGMTDFQTNRTKVLDLVVCTPWKSGSSSKKPKFADFRSLGAGVGVVLTDEESSILDALPVLRTVAVGTVNIALEAKATMTEHIKALPRLHDELDSSHATIHGNSDTAIAAALVTINVSSAFISPGNNKHAFTPATAIWNAAKQPKAAERTIGKVREIRRRTKAGDSGFDAVGIVMIDFKNDGSSCSVSLAPPAPVPSESDHYEHMIARIASLYATQFKSI